MGRPCSRLLFSERYANARNERRISFQVCPGLADSLAHNFSYQEINDPKETLRVKERKNPSVYKNCSLHVHVSHGRLLYMSKTKKNLVSKISN